MKITMPDNKEYDVNIHFTVRMNGYGSWKITAKCGDNEKTITTNKTYLIEGIYTTKKPKDEYIYDSFKSEFEGWLWFILDENSISNFKN